MRRFDVKNLLMCPETRRMMIARGTVIAQARERIVITLEQALESYDYLNETGELQRVREMSKQFHGQ